MSLVLRAMLAALLAVGKGFGAAGCGSSGSGAAGGAETSGSPSVAHSSGSNRPKPSSPAAEPGRASASSTAPSPGSGSSNGDVPARVTATLGHIDAGDWPDAAHAPGTHGGDPFGNREGRLPTTSASGAKITYREWDVNAKRSGQGRDAERIITGSDGSAWFTLDHYDHFTRIR